jgi:hypothetical protein
MINENDYDEAGGEAGWVIESLRQQLEDLSQAYDICQQEHGRMSQQLAAFPPHSHIDALRQQLAEQKRLTDLVYRAADPLKEKLAESQAREKVLRDALVIAERYLPAGYEHAQVAAAALALPSDSTALDTYLEENGWRQCAKGQYITQYCGLVEEAVRQAKREASKYAAEQSQESKKAWGEYAKGCSAEAASIAIRLNQMAEEMK